MAGSMPVAAVLPSMPFTSPAANRIGDTVATPGTLATSSTTLSGIGVKPSLFWTISAAET